jgi:hypothetical protein
LSKKEKKKARKKFSSDSGEVDLTFGTGVLHLIQINHQPDATIFLVYYPDVCLQLNIFPAFSRPSSGAQ